MEIGITRSLAAEERDLVVRECVESFNAYLNRWPEPRTVDGAVLEWEGEGCFVRDVYGREFLDCLGGYGIFALGHRHPKVIAAVTAQLGRLALHSQHLLNPVSAEAAKRLAEITPGRLRKTFWCSSGTEAVEGALKLARLNTGKRRFVSTINSFHGKTLGSLSVTGRPQFRAPFEPRQAYTKFSVFTLLQHQGDYRAAARALADQGYGARTTAGSSGLCTQRAWPALRTAPAGGL